MDDIDCAQEQDDFYRTLALTGYFRRNGINRSAGSNGAQYPGSSGAPADTMEMRASSGPVICIDCGEEIEPARLRALPAAVRCTACQEKLERRSRISGSEIGPRRWPSRNMEKGETRHDA